jgi:hypothetical protein
MFYLFAVIYRLIWHIIINLTVKIILVMFMAKKESKGDISVREAGRRGGTTTKERHGHEFYEKIGHKGGQKVKELIARGKASKK